MDENVEIALDKLPIKRLDVIEENGLEKFPHDIGYDQKRLESIRRIDFAWAVEKDSKKQKTTKETTKPWPWQSLVENLQLAHQELSVIIDLINTVEANDAVTVAGMNRPKPLPNEVLSDLSISSATKLQCFRHLGKYFKQSAKGLEQQIAREARFYGALIRLQKNWKVKRQRTSVSTSSSEGFTIDLCDNSLSDPLAVYRSPSISSIRIDHDPAGMLAVNLPPKLCRSIQFGFLGCHSEDIQKKIGNGGGHLFRKKEAVRDKDVDACVKETHSILREFHRAMFDEQVFDLVNREAFSPSLGVNVTGIRENYLELGIGQGSSAYLSLVPLGQAVDQTDESADEQNCETAPIPSDSYDGGVQVGEERHKTFNKSSGFPSSISCEIYLQQIFNENILVKAKDKRLLTGRSQIVGNQPFGKGYDLLGHFCMTLAHRIFSNKVLEQLENLASKVSYLHLLSRPRWHSRTSSWSLLMKVPESILRAGNRIRPLNQSRKNGIKSQFETKVAVIDDCVNIVGEGSPNVVSLFKNGSEEMCSLNSYDYDLADLSFILLQQVASQVIRWLHEEALLVGMKTSRDFLSLSFELEQGDRLCLVARVDPGNREGCISWWLVMADGLIEEGRLHIGSSNGLQEKHQLELENLTLTAAPFKTFKFFTLATVQYFRRSISYLLTKGGWILLLSTLVLALGVLLNTVDRSHEKHVEELLHYFQFGLWWVALGVASSIGLGSGLHTFVLYLGPHIALFTIKAMQCGRIDLKSAPYDTIQFKRSPSWLHKDCSDFGPPTFPSSHGSSVPISSILPQVQLEAILWGLGTALGELPPYFISRAARISGSKSEAMEELDASSTEDGVVASHLSKIKRWFLSQSQHLNFFTILVLASVPNPLFDLAGIMCGQFGIPFWKFFLATLTGKAIIKTHIQTVFIISVCNNQLLEWLENEMIWVLGFVPGLSSILPSLIAKLHVVKEKYLTTPLPTSVPSDVKAKNWDLSFASIWNSIVWLMLINFFIKIVTTTAQGHLKKQQDKELRALTEMLSTSQPSNGKPSHVTN